MRVRRLWSRALVTLVVVAGLTAAAYPVRADPDDPAQLATEVEQARDQLAGFEDAESAAVEAANAALDDLRVVSGGAIAARRRADAAADELRAARDALVARAIAVYKGGGAA